MRQDKILEVLKGSGGKRPARKGTAVACYHHGNIYTIQVNGRTVESGEGDANYAKERTETRAAAIRALGRAVHIDFF